MAEEDGQDPGGSDPRTLPSGDAAGAVLSAPQPPGDKGDAKCQKQSRRYEGPAFLVNVVTLAVLIVYTGATVMLLCETRKAFVTGQRADLALTAIAGDCGHAELLLEFTNAGRSPASNVEIGVAQAVRTDRGLQTRCWVHSFPGDFLPGGLPLTVKTPLLGQPAGGCGFVGRPTVTVFVDARYADQYVVQGYASRAGLWSANVTGDAPVDPRRFSGITPVLSVSVRSFECKHGERERTKTSGSAGGAIVAPVPSPNAAILR